MKLKLAILDDDVRMGEVLGMMLRREGYETSLYHHPHTFFDAWHDEPVDLLLTDLKMPDMDGLEVLKKVKQERPELPVILITAHATIKTAIEAIREGAFDYVEKPFDNTTCKRLVKRALDYTRLERENRQLREEVGRKYAMENLVASSEAMQETLDLVRRAARGRATVLITGESGTGKEVMARAIHYYSDRVGKPFLAVNCKAFASGILESELFGHERGAFTGANQSHAGLFERANGGTLFLDEIGEVDHNFQAKLLRVLQEREVLRVGGDQPRTVDVRVVAATNRNLTQDVESGQFREDLYYRLAVIPIHLPPLRERRADILPLASHFLARWSEEMGRTFTAWNEDVEDYLIQHDWPGNIRELENAMERAVVLARGDSITVEDLRSPAPRTRSNVLDGTDAMGLHDYLDWAATQKIKQVLDEVSGVRIDAAERLGIERTTLYRLIKKYNIEA